MTQFLKHFRSASGTIMDLEFVKEKALQKLKRIHYWKRCEFVSGDFFKTVSISGDIFVLSRVLHDWNDEDSIKILSHIRSNMTNDSILYIIELIIPESITRENVESVYERFAKFGLYVVGLKRTLSEYCNLFPKKTGLKI